MNSYAEYKNLFKTLMKTSTVKFQAQMNGFEDEFFYGKINSNSAINYYTQSRKVIVLPRYKEHYQSSRKKIKFENQERSYEDAVNKFKKLFRLL